MATRFRLLDDEATVAPVRRDEALTIAVGGREIEIREHFVDGGQRRYVVDGTVHDVFVASDGDIIYVHLDGEVFEVEPIDPIAAAGGGRAGTNAVRAPMPGVVVSIAVAAGDVVHTGQPLMVIESMKLQTSIIAERDGEIETVCYAAEATFEKGAELIRYVDADEQATPEDR